MDNSYIRQQGEKPSLQVSLLMKDHSRLDKCASGVNEKMGKIKGQLEAMILECLLQLCEMF